MQRKIEGEITPVGNLSNAIDVEEWLAALDAALEHVDHLTWHQYTPYFNDGEACVFSYGGIRPTFIEDENIYDLWDLQYAMQNDGLEFSQEAYDALSKFDRASDNFQLGLAEMFGDHAEVTATKDGFSVEYYDHD